MKLPAMRVIVSRLFATIEASNARANEAFAMHAASHKRVRQKALERVAAALNRELAEDVRSLVHVRVTEYGRITLDETRFDERVTELCRSVPDEGPRVERVKFSALNFDKWVTGEAEILKFQKLAHAIDEAFLTGDGAKIAKLLEGFK